MSSDLQIAVRVTLPWRPRMEETVRLPAPATAGQVLAALNLDEPVENCLLTLNQRSCLAEDAVADGDELLVMPFVSGG